MSNLETTTFLQQRKKMRPYLVRRGGGVKVRGETNSSIKNNLSESVEPIDVQFKKFKALPINDKALTNVRI